MRKLVRKVIVDSIATISGADNIELARIGGWQCVVKKHEFNPGDIGVYFEIDSALPISDERYSFLDRFKKEWKNGDDVLYSCFKIRTVKFKGEISQGLLLPIDQFPELDNIPLGEDCTNILKVELFDDLDSKFNLKFKSGDQKGLFPSWIPKTDEERIQNLMNFFKDLKEMRFEVTRKVDGSSMTVFYAPIQRPNDPFGICSRNFELKTESLNSSYISMAMKLNVFEKLKKFFEDTGIELAVQGELNGIGMNANRDNLKDIRFNVFKIFNISNQEFLTCDERIDFCNKYGFDHVPVLKRNFQAFSELTSIEDMLSFAEGKTENGNEREGVVFKEENNHHPVTFKVISNKYLLKTNS